jgi:hypothetical protein
LHNQHKDSRRVEQRATVSVSVALIESRSLALS